MPTSRQAAGAVVDERLAPAGLTRLLGSYGARRAPVLGAAAALFAAACVVLVLLPSPTVVAPLVFVVPVGNIASELGTRAGLISAGLGIALVLAWMATGLAGEGQPATVPRALALVFIGWIIGRTSDRAARSRRLLEQVLESTTDSSTSRIARAATWLSTAPPPRSSAAPAPRSSGAPTTSCCPRSPRRSPSRMRECSSADAPSTYEVSGRFGEDHQVLSVTKSPFCDASGTAVGSPRHRPRHHRAAPAAGALPPRLRERADRDGGRRSRGSLPRRQPGAVRDHRVRARRAVRADVRLDDLSRRPQGRVRRHGDVALRRRQLLDLREALPAPGRQRGVGGVQSHARK